MGREIFRRLAREPASVAEARASLSALKEAVHPATFKTLRLLVSELVTNSVRHRTGARSAPIELWVDASKERVRVEVADREPRFSPAPRHAGSDQGSGWGLYLVAVFSDRWGTEMSERLGVWFELLDSGPFVTKKRAQGALRPRPPVPERRAGPVDRRAAPRPRRASPGTRNDDHLRVGRHLRCTDCGELWLTELVRERFEQGGGCLACGGNLEEVEGAPGESECL